MSGTGAAAGAKAAALVLIAATALRAGLAGRRRSASSARLLIAADGGGPHAHRGRAQRRLALLRPPPGLKSRLDELGVAVDPALAWTVWAAASTGATASALLGAGLAAGVVAASVVVLAPCLAWRVGRHRGAARLEAALPSAVDAVASALRSGASLRQSLAESARATPGPLGADLAVVAGAIERGAGVVAALEGWAARRPLPGVRLVAAALCLGAETGGATARAVDAVAATLRQRLASQAEADALATQARVSAAVIAVAPVAFCVLSATTDPRSAAFLLRTPAGMVVLLAGLSLDALGALWMAKLTRLGP